MKKSVIIIYLFFVGIATVNGQTEFLIKEQQQLIGQLSGKFPLSDGSLLESRDTPENRKIARQYLMDKIEAIGLEPKEQSYRMPNINPLIDMIFSPFRGGNVYTIIPSTNQSNEYVVLGAHFDTELDCPGAIDNASGSALIYSVGKMLNSLDLRRMNVIIVFFDQEEEELVGSQAFAKYLKAEDLNIHSVHTFDMVGWDGDRNKEMELELPTKALEEAYREKAVEMEIPLYVTSINSTDHHSFRQAGFQAIGINEAYGKRDSSPYKDTPADTYETVNFDYLAGSTLFVFEVIKEIINGNN
ncbi:M28 family metallopeptidase [Ekhidna sp. To15]|uniref:M28 family metallopeptidase n=1 Tax=Ekhidna sp. To15 TaxID=3395267 RepID=UPI003F51EA75